MYEELLMDEENTLPTKMRGIMISTGKNVGFDEVETKLVMLQEAIDREDGAALSALESAVPTYTVTKNNECEREREEAR